MSIGAIIGRFCQYVVFAARMTAENFVKRTNVPQNSGTKFMENHEKVLILIKVAFIMVLNGSKWFEVVKLALKEGERCADWLIQSQH